MTMTSFDWPTAFPEVFEDGRGGFDAIIGNPPFLGGQKLTGALGADYRKHLVKHLARGRAGSADLAAYFLLRAHALIHDRGELALIATNTLAQGATCRVGMEQVCDQGATIWASVKSCPWPSKAATLEICVVWITRRERADGTIYQRW